MVASELGQVEFAATAEILVEIFESLTGRVFLEELLNALIPLEL